MPLTPTLSRLRGTVYRQSQGILRRGKMKIAVAGCCHGGMDETYKQVNDLEMRNQYKIDLLLVNGDFEAVRNHKDLVCMAGPKWHRKLGTFYRYYTGEATAPVLTIVIGGNHEASNYMWELYHGGWLAPNIYYLGGSGCVKVNGLRIAGASGIYKPNDYRLGYHERIPYDQSTLRSAYHTRLYDVVKLRQLSSPDVFMSHDWPVNITKHGDEQHLLKGYPRFQSDIEKGELGSPPMMDLLRSIRPTYWFSAHMHCKFEAVVHHESEVGESSVPGLNQASAAPGKIEGDLAGETAGPPVNLDKIQLQDSDANPPQSVSEKALAPRASNPDGVLVGDDGKGSTAALPTDSGLLGHNNSTSANSPGKGNAEQPSSPPKSSSTHFLALDKCGPKREYLHVLDIVPSTPPTGPATGPPTLTYDREWLAISRALHPYLSTTRQQPNLPPVWDMASIIQESQNWVDEHVGEREIQHVQEFVMTAPGPDNKDQKPPKGLQPPPCYTNPQTEAFCAMLGLENKVNPPP